MISFKNQTTSAKLAPIVDEMTVALNRANDHVPAMKDVHAIFSDGWYPDDPTDGSGHTLGATLLTPQISHERFASEMSAHPGDDSLWLSYMEGAPYIEITFYPRAILTVDPMSVRHNFLPMASVKGISTWVPWHEWGHATQKPEDALRLMKDPQDYICASASPLARVRAFSTLRTYAQSDPMEAYAESFAEWHLSGGQTSNPVARYMAKRFNWGI